MSFQIKDLVVHRIHGLCEIAEVIMNDDREFYRVTPLRDSRITIYVPIGANTEIIRKPLDKEEAMEVLNYIKELDVDLSLTCKKRREVCSKKVGSNNPYDLAFLVKTLTYYKNERKSKQLSFSDTDNQILDKALETLVDEFNISFNSNKEETINSINNCLI